jgi:PAS domain S-box-containing protein
MSPETPHYPLRILLFAETDDFCLPLAQAFADRELPVETNHVASEAAFQAALAIPWDVVLVAYPALTAALALLERAAAPHAITLLYRPEEEAQAFAVTAERVRDLLPLTDLRRLAWQAARSRQQSPQQGRAQQRRQLELRFQAIVEGFGDAILLLDAYQIVRYVNSAFGRIFGHNLSAILGRSLAPFLDPAELPNVQDQLTTLGQAVGAIQTVTHSLRRADGAWAFVETTGHSLLDPAGQVFVVLHVRDLSEKIQAEAALLESEQRLRLFVEHAPAAIIMLDRDLRYLAVSQRWLADYHLTEVDVIGRFHYDLFPEISDTWRAIHQQALQGAVTKSEADLFTQADGSIDWIRWEARPWCNSRGDIGGIMIFSEVVTERKRAEAAAREQRLLAETLRDALATLSASTDIDTVMQQILDYSAQVVPSDGGALILFAENQPRVAYTRGYSPETMAFFNTNPMLFDVSTYTKGTDNQTYYLATDTQLTPGWRMFPEIAWIRSSLGVQIILHGKAIGLLTADSAAPNQYQQKDVANLQTFAHYAALALERVSYVTQLEQRVQERTAALEAAKLRVEAILNNSPDSILLIDRTLVIQQVNHAFQQLFDCAADACVGRSLLTFIHPEDQELLQQLVPAVSAEAQDKHLELRAIGAGEIVFEVELSVGHIRDDSLVCVMHDISARKAQERELRYHASLQKTVNDAVFVTDMDARIQSWNPAAERLYGWRAEEAIGRVTVDVLRSNFSSPEERTQHIRRLREQGWWQAELLQYHKDGTPRHIHSSASLVHDERGHAIGVVAVNHDITERKQAEEALRQSSAEIHDLYNRAPCGYHSIDKDGLIVQINDTELQWLGYTREEVVGRLKLTDLFTPESVAVFRHNFPLFRERGWVNDLEFDLVSKDGTIRRILLNATAIYDAAGQYQQSRSTVFDITELRQAQQAIAESEARYRLIAENVTDVITKTSVDGIRTFVTSSCYALLGYVPDELTGRPAADLVHPDEQPLITAIVVQAVEALKPSFTLTQRMRHKNGHYLWVEVIGTIVREPASGAVVEIISVIRDITERKAAEDALRESEARYRLLAENGYDMVSRHNSRGDFLYVSPSTEWLLGYSPGELIGQPGFVLLHPDHWAQMGELMGRASQMAEPPPQIFRARHKDGRDLLLEISVRAVCAEETGEVLEFVSSARDVTEREVAEASLRASEEKFRQVAENFDQMLIIRTADNKQRLFINSAAERLLGIPRAQMAEEPFAFLKHIHPDDLAHVRQALQTPQFSEEGRIELEYRLMRPDGQVRWFQARTFPIKDEHGAIVSRVSTGEDITERKVAELTLQESEAKYRRLVETMNGGLIVLDTDNRMTYVNDRFCEIVGISREELMGATPFAHIDPVNADLVQAHLQRRQRLESSTYEVSLRRRDGQPIHLLSSGSPLHDQTGKYVGGFAVVTDITAQKQAEAALRQALAREKELNELKSRFVSIASHEFRTPLATISATAETIKFYRDRFDGNQLDKRLNKILVQVGYMKEIMDDVLQLERIQTRRVDFRLEPGDLQAFCSEIVEEFRSRPEYQDRITYDSPCAPLPFHFDQRFMRHIIGNLISNGLKYSPAPQPICVDVRRGAEAVTLQVSDQGIGIPEADLQHIFEPFHRAQNVGTISGTGLGLSITKEAVEMHGGQIAVTTTVGIGTTVTVTLPITPQRSVNDAEDPRD